MQVAVLQACAGLAATAPVHVQVGRVLRIVSSGSGAIRLQVNWIYRPEEAEGGRKVRSCCSDGKQVAQQAETLRMYFQLSIQAVYCSFSTAA
jgi:hypothetical protein